MKTLNDWIPILIRSAFISAAAIVSGCSSLPREVGESADETRQAVAQLHGVHAQDARAFARLVTERETYLKEYGDVLRRAFRAKMEAEAEASKARTMAEFDRLATDVLGIQFQDSVSRQINFKFSATARTQTENLSDARWEKAKFVNDPGVEAKVIAAERTVADTQCQRDNVINSYFLALDSALRSARFNFETQVDEMYNEKLASLLKTTAPDANADRALQDFEQRMEKRFAELDEAYYSVDHALSDLSSFLDSEGTSSRFAKHALKGAATALVDDLKGGQLGGFALSDLLGKQSADFSKELQQLETAMTTKAATTVKNATDPLISTQPPQGATSTH